MFYKLGVLDPWGKSPWKRSLNDNLNGTFGGDMNFFARAAEYLEDDVEFREKEKIEDDPTAAAQPLSEIDNIESVAVASEEVPNMLPDG